MNSIKKLVRTNMTSRLHTYTGLVHLASETIFQIQTLARPTQMTRALPNVIATRMALGTVVSILGKARQHRNESLLEKMLVWSPLILNVWLTFLCFTEYTFPVGCGLPFMATLECPWLLPVNSILCSAVTAISIATLAVIAVAPNRDRQKLWAMGKSGRLHDRIFAVVYSAIHYNLMYIVYSLGSWNVGRQVTNIGSWRALFASSQELVNVFANTLTTTMYINNTAVFLKTMGKVGLMKTPHITVGWALISLVGTFRSIESMIVITQPALSSIGIKII